MSKDRSGVDKETDKSEMIAAHIAASQKRSQVKEELEDRKAVMMGTGGSRNQQVPWREEGERDSAPGRREKEGAGAGGRGDGEKSLVLISV